MPTNRREFIERLGVTAMLGTLPATAWHPLPEAGQPGPPAESWDFSWTNAVKGRKHKGLFDCTEIENGHGVWRASIWESHYEEALGARRTDIITVLVLRHRAVLLGLQQEVWDKVGIGVAEKVMHPVTQQSTDRNPALLTAARDNVPEGFDALALPSFIRRGGIVLACNLALQNAAGRWAEKAGIPVQDASKTFVAGLVPGVVLMPSGVFACVKAQEEGCHYVKAS
jgi:hypothetical protein